MQYSVIVLIVLIIVAYLLLSRYLRRRKLSAIATGKSEVILKWKYSPEDWAQYASDPAINWIRNRDLPGEAFITSVSIYVTNGEDEYFYDFGYKWITQCAFLHPFLDLRMEWTGDFDGGIIQRYEDFRLFVPHAFQGEVADLVAEFKTMTEKNARHALKFVEDEDQISLF
jgi:hypothetical protein